MFISIFFVIIGFCLLIKGADFLVEGSSNIAKKMNIPEIIIGLTIVSIGTSMPEFFVSLTSNLDGLSDIAIGNIVGSNIANLLLILGIATIIKPINIKRETKLIDIPICLFVTILFFIICNVEKSISRISGIIFVALFIMFIIYTILVASKEKRKISSNNTIQINKISLFRDVIDVALGIIALKVGAEVSVNNVVKIAECLNVSEKLISVTVLAVGTSLPELFTSVSAAIKGKSDIAIGNIIGSNIFNILWILGFSAIVNPLQYNCSFNKDMIFLILSTILLEKFPMVPPKNQMSKLNGVLFLLIYIAYIFMLSME